MSAPASKPTGKGAKAKLSHAERLNAEVARRNAEAARVRKAETERRKQLAGRVERHYSCRESCTFIDPNRHAREARKEAARRRVARADHEYAYELESTSSELNDLDCFTACLISRDERARWRQAYAAQVRRKAADRGDTAAGPQPYRAAAAPARDARETGLSSTASTTSTGSDYDDGSSF